MLIAYLIIGKSKKDELNQVTKSKKKSKNDYDPCFVSNTGNDTQYSVQDYKSKRIRFYDLSS